MNAIVMVDRGVDITCEVNFQVAAMTHEAHKRTEKVNIEPDRQVERVIPEVDRETNDVLLEVVLKDLMQEMPKSVDVNVMLNGVDEEESVVPEDGIGNKCVDEVCWNNVCTEEVELVQEAIIEEWPLNKITLVANSA